MNRSSKLLLTMIAVGVIAIVACEPPPPPEPECQSDADCAIGSICEAGACEEAVCPDVFDPVCGEDGETYPNACEARAAHVAVGHEGECPQECAGFSGGLCSEGQFCDEPRCGNSDIPGVCVDIPEVCPEIFDPVCGCDGTTYSNDCFRIMAQVQLQHQGECGTAEQG